MYKKRILLRSDHDPETWLKLWDRRIVKLDSQNKAAYSGERCFFGTQDGRNLMVYFHKDYQNAYLLTRFMGTIEPDGSGCKITGVIGKMKTAIIFLWFMFFAMGIGGIVMLTQHQLQQALVLFVLAAIGLACALITPTSSVRRLENLLKIISVDDYDPDEEEEIKQAIEEAVAEDNAAEEE